MTETIYRIGHLMAIEVWDENLFLIHTVYEWM
jgi:hypothetical protein